MKKLEKIRKAVKEGVPIYLPTIRGRSRIKSIDENFIYDGWRALRITSRDIDSFVSQI